MPRELQETVIQVRVTKSLFEAIQDRARTLGITISDVVRDATTERVLGKTAFRRSRKKSREKAKSGGTPTLTQPEKIEPGANVSVFQGPERAVQPQISIEGQKTAVANIQPIPIEADVFSSRLMPTRNAWYDPIGKGNPCYGCGVEEGVSHRTFCPRYES